MHGGIINVHVVQRNIWIFAVYVGDDVSPELKSFQHIGLVHTSQAFVAFLRSLKGDVGDAADFTFCIAHGVETFVLALERTIRAFAHAARLAEIHVAGQFADDQNIKSGNHFRLQRRCTSQLRIQNRRTKIGKQIQVFAQAENCLLRAQRTFQCVVFPVADRAEQNRIGFFRQLQRAFRQRMAVRCVSGTANRRSFHFKRFAQRIQYQ